MIELGYFAVHECRVAEWEQSYPGLDVRMELVKMKLWLEANPKRRKKNYYRFVVNWLNKTHAKLLEAEVRATCAREQQRTDALVGKLRAEAH